MKSKKQILLNLNWNWAGIFVDTAVAFLLCPYLIRHLGAGHYGMWVMIGSLTGYFGLLDLGIRSSVGRYVAFYRAKQDQRAVCEIVNTALAMLLGAGLIGMLGVLGAGQLAPRLIGDEFAPHEFSAIRIALCLAGVHLALLLPLKVFEGALWGCERFDCLNLVRIPSDVLRGTLAAITVAFDGGLIGLMTVTLGITLFAGLVRAILALRSEPSLRLSLRHVVWRRIRELLSFGVWNFIRSLASMIPSKITPLLVGVLAGVIQVACLSIAASLLSGATAIVVAASGVITPVATALHARDARCRQKELLLEGGKYSLAAAGLFLALFVMLGKPLISLWVGSDYETSYQLLVILAIGRCVSMSQVVTRGIITAQAKHKMLALASIFQGVATVAFAPVVIDSLGVVGVCIVVAVADALGEGVFSLVYGCRLTSTSVSRHVQAVVGSTVLATALPCGLLGAVVSWRPVGGWLDLILYGASFAIVYLASVVLVFERPDLRWKRIQGEPSQCVT